MQTTKLLTLSLTQARRIALHCQLLDGRTRLPKGKEGLAQVIERLGYVQIDTISVLRRAHEHTLWIRCPDFEAEDLYRLQAIDRRVFEYWGHALSYLPMSDYRFYRRQMMRFLDPHGKWENDRLKKYGHLLKPVLEQVRSDGPICSRDLEDSPSRKTWEPKPMRFALEMLQFQGEVMVTERRKNKRFFDLTERVLPANVDISIPSDDELGRFLVRRALGAYGVAREADIQKHIFFDDKALIRAALSDMVSDGTVAPVSITDMEPNGYYALVEVLERAARLRQSTPRLHLLSPFDNLIILRDRVARLFGFDYALECYTPAVKRQFGYYVLPILWGEEFVGRLDAKAERPKRVLRVKSLLLEPSFKRGEDLAGPLADKLWGLAAFTGCEKITVDKTTPPSFRRVLQAVIARDLSR